MARYQVRINNVDRFDRAFFDTQCGGCDAPINEGEPIWRIKEEHQTFYACRECALEYGDPGSVLRKG